MPKLSEILGRAVAWLLLGALCVAPFYMATLLPNPAEPTGLELLDSFFLGLLVRLLLIFGGLHLLLRSMVCLSRDDKLLDAVLSGSIGCGMAAALVYLT